MARAMRHSLRPYSTAARQAGQRSGEFYEGGVRPASGRARAGTPQTGTGHASSPRPGTRRMFGEPKVIQGFGGSSHSRGPAEVDPVTTFTNRVYDAARAKVGPRVRFIDFEHALALRGDTRTKAEGEIRGLLGMKGITGSDLDVLLRHRMSLFDTHAQKLKK